MGLIFLKKEKERIEETAKKQRFESYSDQTCLSYIDATNFFTINKIDLCPFSPLTLQKLLPNHQDTKFTIKPLIILYYYMRNYTEK